MDNLEYIDNYFRSKPGPDQIKEFEEKVVDDPAFAEDVAFYLSANQTLKEELETQKKKEFRELYLQSATPVRVISASPIKRLWKQLAAAAVTIGIIISTYLYTQAPSMESLASKYIDKELKELPVKMGVNDSLQEGKNLYNKGEFSPALAMFESILANNPTSSQAREFAGKTALQLHQYEKALQYFSSLANENLTYNPGKFYQALTLMKRNGPHDKEDAIRLLEEVVTKNLDKSDEAKKWLDDLK